MRCVSKLYALFLVGFLLWALPAAAAPPDAGSILRDIDEAPRMIPEAPVPPPPKTLPGPPSVKEGPRVQVQAFRFTGNTLFTEAELADILEDFRGRELSFADLEQAVQQVAAHYSAKGYLARAVLPPQEIKDGIVLIQVIEGKLGEVKVDLAPEVRFDGDRAAAYITTRQPPGGVLRLDALEEGLLTLNDNSGVVATATMEAGGAAGTTDLRVKLDSRPLLRGSLDFDNFGSVSTGEYRATGNLYVESPARLGDFLSITGLSSLDTNYGRIAYALPIGTWGTRIGAHLSYLDYELRGDLKSLDASGDAFTAGFNVSHPLMRTRQANLSAAADYEYGRYDDRALGSDTRNKKINRGTLSLNGDWYDTLFGGGYSVAGIATTFGDVDLSDNAADLAQDRAGPGVDGSYAKLSFRAGRLQNIRPGKTALWLGLHGQFAGSNLDSSEKISLGGPSAVRALPPNEGNGDHGFIVTAELRQMLTPAVQLFGFYDFGWIQQHKDTWNNWNAWSGTPNSYEVDGFGAGLTWMSSKQFSVRGMVAQRLRKNPGRDVDGDDSDGTRREPRFWIQASLYF